MGFTRGILLLDSCEGTLAWVISGTGGDYAGAYAAVAAWIGTNGLSLQTKTTTPAENDIVRAVRTLEWVESGLVALRLWFACPDISAVKKVMFRVEQDDGTDLYQADVEYLPGTQKVQYLTVGEAMIETTIDPGAVADGQWSMAELVVDMTLHNWVSLRMFGQRVDLAGVPIWLNAGNGSIKGMIINIDVIADGSDVAAAYFDQIYVGEHVDL